MDLETKIENKLNFKNNFEHIPYKEKIFRAYQELINTDPSSIMSW
jgi:hypothetical protein